MEYPVTLTKDDNDTYLVTFPDFPEAQTFGDDRDDALARAVDALATAIDAYIKDRRDIPAPSRGRLTVEVPSLTAVKLELYAAMRVNRVGKAELARRLDWHLPQVDRLLDVRHASRLDQMERALSVLGKRIVLSVEDVSGSITHVLTQRATVRVRRKGSVTRSARARRTKPLASHR